MAFNTGIVNLQKEIEKADQRAKAATSGASGSSLGYFNWKPGDKKILRFLTDAVITEDFYDFIVDKEGGTKTFLVDPTDPARIKRYMAPTPGIGWQKEWGTGNLREPQPRQLGVGVAVLRTERPDDSGKLILEDYVYDKDIEGTNYHCRFFGIVQQSVSNFWHTLATTCFSRYGSITTVDYLIERQGEGRKTKYSIIPLPEVAELSTPESVKQFYFYGAEWNKEDPNRYLKCPQTLDKWAEYFSSEERHNFWLTPDDGSAPAGGTATSATAATSSLSSMQSTGLDEFSPATTTNPVASPPADEAQASQPSGTSFASLQETLLGDMKVAPDA